MLLADVIGRHRLSILERSSREFCWKAHCDFVVVARSSMEIEHVVEVNGGFHMLPGQIVRDAKKAKILAQFNIDLRIFRDQPYPKEGRRAYR